MPVGFVFDLERLIRLRRSLTTVAGTLDLPRRERRISSSDDWRVRGYRIESRVLDGDGRPTGERLRTAATTVSTDPLSGERKAHRAVVTIMGWEDVVVLGDGPVGKYRPLTREDAVACGYVTVDGLRAAWRQEYPATDFARLYWFRLGDWRERTVWMSAGAPIAGRHGDYTTNSARALDRDAPVLTDAELEPISMAAKQRDVARRARISAAYASGSLAERVARIAR